MDNKLIEKITQCVPLPCLTVAQAETAAEDILRVVVEACAEVIDGFDSWQLCECSECKLDARSHAIAIEESRTALLNEIRALLNVPTEESTCS